MAGLNGVAPVGAPRASRGDCAEPGITRKTRKTRRAAGTRSNRGTKNTNRNANPEGNENGEPSSGSPPNSSWRPSRVSTRPREPQRLRRFWVRVRVRVLCSPVSSPLGLSFPFSIRSRPRGLLLHGRSVARRLRREKRTGSRAAGSRAMNRRTRNSSWQREGESETRVNETEGGLGGLRRSDWSFPVLFALTSPATVPCSPVCSAAAGSPAPRSLSPSSELPTSLAFGNDSGESQERLGSGPRGLSR